MLQLLPALGQAELRGLALPVSPPARVFPCPPLCCGVGVWVWVSPPAPCEKLAVSCAGLGAGSLRDSVEGNRSSNVSAAG